MAESKDYTYLIIGGGMVADSASHGIRERDDSATIGILSLEEDPPATRPALSKKLWTDTEFTLDKVWLDTEHDTGAVRHPLTQVTGIDRDAKKVHTAGGQTYGYEKLLLATGGTPRMLGLPAHGRVIAFHSVDDYRRLRGFVNANQHIAVVGGSFIGTEIAAALIQNGADVSLIFAEEVLGGAIFPQWFTEKFERTYSEAGIHVIPRAAVSSATISGDTITLKLPDNRMFDTDVVVLGLGVEPNVEMASAAGLSVNDGVVVSDRLETDDPHIWAAGDIAEYPDNILGRQRLEHVDNAEQMGRQAGRNMAGANEPYDYTPYFYSSVFGNRYEAIGTVSSSLDIVEVWSDPPRRGVIYYRDGQSLVGVLLWNVAGARERARELLAHPTQHSADELRASIPLSDDQNSV